MTIGERLRILRKEQCITQQQLADQAGISRSNINTWESGKSLPLPDGLIALADCFGCSIDYLLGRETEEGSVIISHGIEISNDEQEFLKLYRRLSNRQKFAALNFVKGMLAS
mgnify:CR=1 FL=1